MSEQMHEAEQKVVQLTNPSDVKLALLTKRDQDCYWEGWHDCMEEVFGEIQKMPIRVSRERVESKLDELSHWVFGNSLPS